MFYKKHNKPPNRIDTLIGVDTTIEGNLSFSGGMRIDGHIIGDVIAAEGKPSTLVLSEHGSIKGQVHVTHLVVNGEICGAVTASDYLELHAKARVTGDIHYKSLEMQVGAVLAGCLIHINAADQKKVVPLKTNKA